MNLANLPEAYEKVKNDLKDRNVLEALGHTINISDNLKQKWKQTFKEYGYDKAEFVNGNIILSRKGTTTFSSLPELLSSCYIYEYYSLLDEYRESLMEIIKDAAPDKDDKVYTNWAKEARDKHSGPFITYIDESSLSDSNKTIMKEFVTDYTSWSGDKSGRTVNRADFSQSAAYKILNVSQSLSSMHDYYKYYKDRDLYKLTLEEVNKILDDYHSSDFYHINSPIKDGKNIIYYGAPGTGKSYSINNIIKETYSDYDAAKDNNDNVFRVTLHPEYTYTDFVGQLLPHSDDQKNVNYQFTPGIFTNVLKQAEDHKDEKIYLVLEEMSRANVAAVFGDLFQLLDRKNGSSEYAINNEEIAKIVYKDPKHKVIIPSNMTILGTVNTSDQNVFVMDTAFKRRFDWKYISTDAGADSDDFKNNNNPKINIGDDTIVTWKTLYQALNRFIVGDLGLSEDKQIGPYFIKFEGADPATAHELVRDKLLQYLWEDINSTAMEMYTSSNRLFEDRDKISSFSDLYNKFGKKEKVFSDSFIKSLGVSDIENSSED